VKVLAALFLAGPVGAASADEPPIQVRRTTESGREVLIRGLAEFNGNCRLRHVDTITVVTPLGEMTIGPNWVGNAECEGTKLHGVRDFYVPNDGCAGKDRAVLEIEYHSNRKVQAELDVTGRAK